MRCRYLGTGCAMLSAVIFGATPLLAKAAYSSGSNEIALIFGSTVTALPVLALLLVTLRIDCKVTRKQWLEILITGTLGGSTTMLLFASYNYVATGIATTLHFTYPAFVCIGSLIFMGQRITGTKAGALALSLAGMLLAADFGGSMDLRGAGLALLSGLTYSAYILALELTGLKQMNFIKLCFYMSIVKTVIAGIYGLVAGKLGIHMDGLVMGLTLVMGILSVILAVILFQMGVCYAGAANAAVFSLLEPVTSLMLGTLCLSEPMTCGKGIGCVFILAGIFLTVREGAQGNVCYKKINRRKNS